MESVTAERESNQTEREGRTVSSATLITLSHEIKRVKDKRKPLYIHGGSKRHTNQFFERHRIAKHTKTK